MNKLSHGILKASGSTQVIMDDESYFTLEGSQTPGNDSYYSHELLETPEKVKYRFKSKYPSKVMVWLTINEKGYSKPFITDSKEAVNRFIYINECIKKRLIKFIKINHQDGDYVFWPDLASAHYAKDTLEAFTKFGIKFIDKRINPPNVPQVRPIEDFWAILKRKVYSDGWVENSTKELKKKIRKELRSIPASTFRSLMGGLKTKLRKAADGGVLSIV